MSHANAALTPRARLRLARLIVEDGWPVARAAERYDVSWATASRWAQRYRQAGHLGLAAMTDRSSRPHHQPGRTPQPMVRAIVHLRWRKRLGPVAIGARSRAWTDTCTELNIRPKKTRPYRPQTNGKIERFHRTLAAGWAFARMFPNESARRHALPGWLHEYNHHRPHTAIGNHPPITRLTNLPGQYTYPPAAGDHAGVTFTAETAPP